MKANEVMAIRERSAARRLAAGASLVLALTFAGCGASNPLNPNPTPTPTPAASKAVVALTLASVHIDVGTLPGFAFTLVSNLHLAESAGVAANIDYIRLDVYLADDTPLERTQISAAQIPGGNALAASGVRDFAALGLGFNSDIVTGRYVIVSVGTTDTHGNAQVASSGKLIFG
jgi:hypothetical protein